MSYQWKHPQSLEARGSLDFETYSEAGLVLETPTPKWDEAKHKWLVKPPRWVGPRGAPKGTKGLKAVGAPAYSEHPTTEVLVARFQLVDDPTIYEWRPGMPNPQNLFDALAAGMPLGAHNSMFEWLIWTNVCVVKYGWPPLPPYALRCSAAQARVLTLPGKLEKLGEVLRLPMEHLKDKMGKTYLDRLSVPRNPTASDNRVRIRPEDDVPMMEGLVGYCGQDVSAERAGVQSMPDMSPDELRFWFIDQEINRRGMAVDVKGVHDCRAVLDAALERYGEEYRQITNGLEPTQVQATLGWLRARGAFLPALDEEAVSDALKRDYHPEIKRVLEIRATVGSASVKKLYALANRVSRDGRLRDVLMHHGARTGRPTGNGPQPLNLPKDGPALRTCEACGGFAAPKHDACPWCATTDAWKLKDGKPLAKWDGGLMTDAVLAVMASRNLDTVEWYFGDAVKSIMGCLRGLFTAGEGMELIASDFSAIEAVVTAMLSGEQWRIEAFKDRKDIYLASASKITGRTMDEYAAYKASTGEHHPDRQKPGKPAELGLGFGGWVGAWLQFDDSGTYTEDEIKRLILAWRDASPCIVEFWGGQHRGRPWDRDRRREMYGLEGAAIMAIMDPSRTVTYAGMDFYMVRTGPHADQDALKVRLLSGRELTYHEPRLSVSSRDPSEWAITYKTWNTNAKMGPMNVWTAMSTYGGRLCENIVQATAHDILRYAIENLRLAGYHTVLHVYDEIIVEVPRGTGSIEEVERIMATMPPWACGWPIRADGGWRGFRYRKA